jgi:hypothetical protein
MIYRRCFVRVTVLLTLCCACALPARAGLIHCYTFNNGGKDAVGDVHANLKGEAKVENGKLVLNNGEKLSTDPSLAYVEFASSPLPKQGSVTLMIWFTATDTVPYARLLNFSDQEAGEGRSFIYLTPRNADDQTRAGITPGTVDERIPIDADRLDDGKPHMVTIVIDGATRKMHLYVDGKAPSTPVDLGTASLDKVKPVQNWIGRSSFEQDGGLTATIDEFRVYDHALTAEEIAAAHKAGPDASPAPTTQPAKGQ